MNQCVAFMNQFVAISKYITKYDGCCLLCHSVTKDNRRKNTKHSNENLEKRHAISCENGGSFMCAVSIKKAKIWTRNNAVYTSQIIKEKHYDDENDLNYMVKITTVWWA